MADIDSLSIAAVHKLAEQYETYARFYLPDSNLGDAASQNQARAKEIIERAIAAMGRRQALLAITQMRAKFGFNHIGTSSRAGDSTRSFHPTPTR